MCRLTKLQEIGKYTKWQKLGGCTDDKTLLYQSNKNFKVNLLMYNQDYVIAVPFNFQIIYIYIY